MLTHGDVVTGWHDVTSAWALDSLVILAALVAAFHVLGAPLLRRSASHRAARAVMVLSLVIALGSPLDSLADSLFSAHMVQHLVLVVVAAPATAICRPWRDVAHRLPLPWRQKVVQTQRLTSRAARNNGTALATIATTSAVTTLLIWHVPAMYDAAVTNSLLHAIEHVSLLVTWTALWATLRRHLETRNIGPALAGLATLSMAGNALGALLVFSNQPWYDVHASTSRLGLSTIADQQLAGIEMWILPTIGVLVLIAHILLKWLSRPTATSSCS